MRLALIGLGALVLRVVYALTLADDDNAPVEGGDRYFFTRAAQLLLDGEGFVHPFVWDVAHVGAPTAAHPPLWTLVLAAVGGPGEDGARVVGAVVGALAVVLAGLLARALLDERAGLAAAAIAALYPAWILGDGSGMSEGLYVALVAAAVLALVRPVPVLAGALIGLAALARTEGLLLLAFAAAPLLWRQWRALAVVAAAAAVTLAPWTIRNVVQLDRLVPVSTNTETVIAGANCDATWYGR